ncbi:MAG: SufE family protein [Alphaproteobacteria bacterium]|nr:SufE family protein [Alphaproteobacteria bacterium]QQS56632.1 MAG: SufE family protein [Alphaproteobacteria bacterium]
MSPTLTELAENFSLFSDWEERYRYLIDLGRSLPHMEEALKTESSLVRGCTSRVWLVAERREDGTYHFAADSDAHIVRGLIALLLAGYQDKSAEAIADTDVLALFREIGLEQHLSPNRRNGFYAMVERIRALTCAAISG